MIRIIILSCLMVGCACQPDYVFDDQLPIRLHTEHVEMRGEYLCWPDKDVARHTKCAAITSSCR